MSIEYKRYTTTATVQDADQGIIEAVVSCFGGAPDHDNDVVEKGAFARVLAERKGKAKLPPGVLQHDLKTVVAKTLDAWEADDGLHVVGKFSLDASDSRDTYYKIRDGLLDEYSFAYVCRQHERKGNVRHIQDVDWIEWSVVTHGSNPNTHTVTVKEKPRAGLTLDEHFETARAVVEELSTRVKEIHGLRAAEGRTINQERVAELKTLRDALDSLLEQCRPRISPEEIAQLHTDYLSTLARINGLA